MRSHLGILCSRIVNKVELKPGLASPIDCQVVVSLWVTVCSVYIALLFAEIANYFVSLVLAGFSEQPTPQQLQMQDRYKEALKQQVSTRSQSFFNADNCLMMLINKT